MKLFCFACLRWVALFLICNPATLQAEAVWLSALDLNQMTTGWSNAKADHDTTGHTISIAKKTFYHGMGTQATSKFRVELGGNGRRFMAKVGVDDSSAGQGSVEFIVEGDGKGLWRSGVMTGGQTAIEADVNLDGVKILTLRATDGGDGESNDHANWADAKIEMADGAAKPAALPPYETFCITTKNLSLIFQVGDDRRLYQHAIGADKMKLQRAEESYPQAGDGFIWEPALQVVHADGNTSTTLTYGGMARSKDENG